MDLKNSTGQHSTHGAAKHLGKEEGDWVRSKLAWAHPTPFVPSRAQRASSVLMGKCGQVRLRRVTGRADGTRSVEAEEVKVGWLGCLDTSGHIQCQSVGHKESNGGRMVVGTTVWCRVVHESSKGGRCMRCHAEMKMPPSAVDKTLNPRALAHLSPSPSWSRAKQ